MITDVFAADLGSLPAYKRAGFPSPGGYGYPTVRARGLDPAALAVLDILLSGVTADQALADATRTSADEPDLYAEPVVALLSERVVRMLPAVGDDKIGMLAADWAAQAGLDTVPAAAVAAWLADLRRMLPDVVAEGRILFVWNCL